MTDYARFKRGAKTFPLATSTGKTALFDADPFVFYALEFFANVIGTHVGPRLLEAATTALPSLTSAVAMTVPFDPMPQLASTAFKFPLLGVYRTQGKLDNVTIEHRRDESTFEIIYVLPPLNAAGAERLAPFLAAVRDVLDDRTDLGFDPGYTPTGGSVGDTVWVTYAGAERVKLTEYSIGDAEGPTDDLFFYALVMRGYVAEQSDIATDTFDNWNGGDASIDLKDPVDETTISDFVQISTFPAPTLTLATPNSGTKAGGTTVTITGTNFRVSTTPTVTFGGLQATNVVVVSATTITCKTPAHSAYTTFLADVVITDTDGQSGTLPAGYTFTTP